MAGRSGCWWRLVPYTIVADRADADLPLSIRRARARHPHGLSVPQRTARALRAHPERRWRADGLPPAPEGRRRQGADRRRQRAGSHDERAAGGRVRADAAARLRGPTPGRARAGGGGPGGRCPVGAAGTHAAGPVAEGPADVWLRRRARYGRHRRDLRPRMGVRDGRFLHAVVRLQATLDAAAQSRRLPIAGPIHLLAHRGSFHEPGRCGGDDRRPARRGAPGLDGLGDASLARLHADPRGRRPPHRSTGCSHAWPRRFRFVASRRSRCAKARCIASWAGSRRASTPQAARPGKNAPPDRHWLAPIVERRDLPALLAQVLPVLSMDRLEWQPVHPGAVPPHPEEVAAGLAADLPAAGQAARLVGA